MHDFFTRHTRELAFALIIVLVATISFALGYLASRELNRTPIVIELNDSR